MFRKTIISAAFALIQRFLIDRIEVPALKTYLQSLLNPSKQVADILTDANPNNKEQLEAFWNENKLRILGPAVDGAIEAVIIAAQTRLKDPQIRDLVIELLREIQRETPGIQPVRRIVTATES